MKRKIHETTISEYQVVEFKDYQGRPSMKLLVPKTFQGIKTLDSFRVSGVLGGFESLTDKIKRAEKEDKPLKVKFVNWNRNKFINEVEILNV